MNQVVFIHGGDAYDSYEQYLADLRTWSIDPTGLKRKWRMTLKEDLGSDFQVYMPEMPNKQNAKYEEWKIWMDKYLPFLNDGVILVGHSLGGIFLVKYLGETKLPVSLRALYLVSTPLFTLDSPEGGDFRFDVERLRAVEEKAQEILIFHAENDPVVPFSHAEAYMTAFPHGRLARFAEGGHFVQESFPELVESIRGLE